LTLDIIDIIHKWTKKDRQKAEEEKKEKKKKKSTHPGKKKREMSGKGEKVAVIPERYLEG